MKATKHDDGKVSYSSVSPVALREIAKALEFGQKKYGRWNYRGGFKWSRLYDSTFRHLLDWYAGQNVDPESGIHPLAHVAANIFMLLDHVLMGLGKDDRYREDGEDAKEV